MVIHFRVDFEIADHRANDLVVGAVSAVEYLKFPLKDRKQLLDIAMLSGQAPDTTSICIELTATFSFIPCALRPASPTKAMRPTTNAATCDALGTTLRRNAGWASF
jgi:hypothetical protein